jgi:SAM-dependent methyltransferase
MANEANFWQLWAPHLVYLEDNHLDLRAINALVDKISSPTLVVGGGQGLLVNELQKKGLHVDGVDSSPEMVKWAEQRRGVKLVLTDGSSLPFADNSYETSIIATGVVDFLDDEEKIRQIINETCRVTKNDGRLLISFYKLHPITEIFLKRIGIVTEHGTLRRRRIFSLSRLSPMDFIAAIRTDGNMSLFSAVFEAIKLQLLLPKQERVMTKNLSMILKTADNADELIDSVSETNPYRNQESIVDLFRKLDMSITELMKFDACFVAEVSIKQ